MLWALSWALSSALSYPLGLLLPTLPFFASHFHKSVSSQSYPPVHIRKINVWQTMRKEWTHLISWGFASEHKHENRGKYSVLCPSTDDFLYLRMDDQKISPVQSYNQSSALSQLIIPAKRQQVQQEVWSCCQIAQSFSGTNFYRKVPEKFWTRVKNTPIQPQSKFHTSISFSHW